MDEQATRVFTVVDYHSGYVWGTKLATSPVEACRLLDEEEARVFDKEYELAATAEELNNMGGGGYIVHEGTQRDLDGDDLDGQDPEYIEEVSKRPFVAYVKTNDPSSY